MGERNTWSATCITITLHIFNEFTGKAETRQRICRKSSGTGCDDVSCLDSRFQHSGESVTTVNSYEQISELLTECVLKGEVIMNSQEQLVQCSRILMLERRLKAVNEDDHERKAHWSRGGVDVILCLQPVQRCTTQSCTVHW